MKLNLKALVISIIPIIGAIALGSGMSGGGGGGGSSGITSINSDTTAAQTIAGASNVGVSTSGGTTTISGSSLSPIAGSSSIATVGTVTSGTWNGTAIGATYGGTGQTTATQGDILYASAANTWSKLAAGTSGNFLKTQGAGANPTWAAVAPSYPLLASGGSVSAPDYSWSASTNDGFYRIGSGDIALSLAGTKFLEWSSNLITIGDTTTNNNMVQRFNIGAMNTGGNASYTLFQDGSSRIWRAGINSAGTANGAYQLYNSGFGFGNKAYLSILSSADAYIVTASGGGDSAPIAAGSSGSAQLGGTIASRTSSAGAGCSNAGTDDTLQSYSLPGHTFCSTCGQIIRIRAYGTTAATANARQFKLKMGSTAVFDSGSLALNGNTWKINCEGWPDPSTANTYNMFCEAESDSALLVSTVQNVTVSSTMTSSLTIATTGNCSAANDIKGYGLVVEYGAPGPG